MSSVRKSIFYSVLSSNFTAILQFGSTMVLARLLTPTEVGVYSVAAVLVGLAAIFRQFGIGNYLVQVDTISRETLRAAFGLMLSTALIISCVLLLAAPSAAIWYREPGITLIIQILALNFFITPFGAITMALVQRDMRFRALMIANVISTLVSITTSIVLAYFGYGAISLAWGGVAGTTATVACAIWLRTPEMPWMPSFRGTQKIIRFGLSSVGANTIASLNINAPDIFIGRLLDMEAVGFFNRATSLTRLVSTSIFNAISPVMLPWLSKLKRANEPAEPSFIKVTELVTGITWPAFATIAIFSEPLIQVLFGDQWGASAPLIVYICIGTGISMTYVAAHPIFISRGMPHIQLFAQAINFSLKVVAIVVASPFGLLAIAMTWPVLSIVEAATHQILLSRHANVSVYAALIGCRKSLIIAMIVILGSALSDAALTRATVSAPVHIIAGSFVSLIAFFLGVHLTKHAIHDELYFFLSRVKRAGPT